jgi:hypothetical protein
MYDITLQVFLFFKISQLQVLMELQIKTTM